MKFEDFKTVVPGGGFCLTVPQCIYRPGVGKTRPAQVAFVCGDHILHVLTLHVLDGLFCHIYIHLLTYLLHGAESFLKS